MQNENQIRCQGPHSIDCSELRFFCDWPSDTSSIVHCHWHCSHKENKSKCQKTALEGNSSIIRRTVLSVICQIQHLVLQRGTQQRLLSSTNASASHISSLCLCCGLPLHLFECATWMSLSFCQTAFWLHWCTFGVAGVSRFLQLPTLALSPNGSVCNQAGVWHVAVDQAPQMSSQADYAQGDWPMWTMDQSCFGWAFVKRILQWRLVFVDMVASCEMK